MSEYYMIITDAGAAMEAAAHASGMPVTLTEFAAGDGGGIPVTPDPTRTALVNEVYRGNISSLTINPDDNTILNAQCVIPADSGGYTVREIGIYADDGTLYAIGNYIEQVKPDPSVGMAITMDVSVELAVSDTSDITLYLNPGDYLTREEADRLYLKLTGGKLSGPGELEVDGALTAGSLVTLKDPAAASRDIMLHRFMAEDGLTENLDFYDADGWLFAIHRNTSTGEISTTTNGPVFDDSGRVYSPGNPPPATDLSGYYTKEEANARFIQSIQLGGEVDYARSGEDFDYRADPGCMVTGMNVLSGSGEEDNIKHIYSRPVQMLINGVWQTVNVTNAILPDMQSDNIAMYEQRLQKAINHIITIQCSAAAGNPREADASDLLALQQYVDQLRDVDLDNPVWPEPPSILS